MAKQDGKNFHPMLADRVVSNPGKYYKQFIAVANSAGEKEVWVNCLCRVDEQRWHKELIYVEDGGKCYFQLKINLTTGKVSDFSVNGVA